MNENGGSQPKATAPDVPESSRPAPVMDVVRRPVEPPVQRAEIAPPPEVMEQIAPKEPSHQPKPDVTPPPVEASKPDEKLATVDTVDAGDKPVLPGTEPQPVIQEAPAEEDDEPEKLIEDHPKSKAVKDELAKPAAPTKPAKSGSPVMGAIIATVFIVIVLAGLAVFAYLQSR